MWHVRVFRKVHSTLHDAQNNGLGGSARWRQYQEIIYKAQNGGMQAGSAPPALGAGAARKTRQLREARRCGPLCRAGTLCQDGQQSEMIVAIGPECMIQVKSACLVVVACKQLP